jgi:hypothetical protein
MDDSEKRQKIDGDRILSSRTTISGEGEFSTTTSGRRTAVAASVSISDRRLDVHSSAQIGSEPIRPWYTATGGGRYQPSDECASRMATNVGFADAGIRCRDIQRPPTGGSFRSTVWNGSVRARLIY